mmetsp:Transcript_21364/g.42794  ORF Transcript_21364/g.42794 Transcript_21364/m.42794 type:complete len:99 (-) Transcript_21364:93-389(-)
MTLHHNFFHTYNNNFLISTITLFSLHRLWWRWIRRSSWGIRWLRWTVLNGTRTEIEKLRIRMWADCFEFLFFCHNLQFNEWKGWDRFIFVGKSESIVT